VGAAKEDDDDDEDTLGLDEAEEKSPRMRRATRMTTTSS
jgi:hypothetical protein